MDKTEIASKPTDFNLSQWPFFWTTRLSSRYTLVMDEALKPMGLDIPSWRVLMALFEQDNRSVSELADITVIRLNTMTKIVQRMETGRLLTTRARATDRRVTEASITAKGLELRHRGWEVAEQVMQRAFEGIPDADRAVVNSVLSRVFAKLNEMN
ncbi:MarR family winged helix-turn-helix transcriptional regulator [Sulfitobacter sp. F26204]|uniref:MarR family winged helix-turn-helix transcriptional regulator n=1 Tax=Sulfitobacter sp. F26204 TaxID=2996014 RepID=UPI00225E2A0E|nr:MarR family winged helix-turn-helix transcriptional regulator [Sulfitobacter sp. F26204]MCX7561724.1 MarR family winged helix-turn-helix transcriptional regulator [Sulfitobacter sp. F26204]